MSHEAMAWGYEQIVKHRLKPGPQVTLLRLCNHANAKGLCWPSLDHLAAMTNQNEKTVRRHLERFVEVGLLEKKPRGGSGAGRKTTVYGLVGLTDILSDRANGHFEQANGHQMSDSTPYIYKPSIEPSECAFAQFWQVYPVKRNKARAEQIWKRKKLDAIAGQLIADVTTRSEKDSQWLRGYIPHPTTYLNCERWDDELITENPDGKAGNRPLTHDEAQANLQRKLREAERGCAGDTSVVATQ